MKFYRLEKPNYFKIWSYAILRALLLGLLSTIIIMLISGYQFMIVISTSMEPTIPVGSLIIITPCDYEDLNDGDIVTMDSGGINLTHRIVGKFDAKKSQERGYLLPGDEGYDEQRWWVTKGDATETIDGALTDNIVGRVSEGHAFTWVGTCVRYIRANYTMLIVLLIIMIAFVSVLEWLKGRLESDDIECYENDDEE